MLVGRLTKAEHDLWVARCEAIGAITQGDSRADACSMLAELVELMAREELGKAVHVAVTETTTSERDVADAAIASDTPGVLAALVLRHQRERNKLSIADVSKRLGAASRNAYAAYERGQREPSLSKFIELLAAVAPDFEMTIGPRSSAVRERRGGSRTFGSSEDLARPLPTARRKTPRYRRATK